MTHESAFGLRDSKPRHPARWAERVLTRAVRGLFSKPAVAQSQRVPSAATRQPRWVGLEQLEPRLLMSADLVVDAPSLASTGSHAPGEAVEVAAVVRNIGDTAVTSPIRVDLYARPTASTGPDIRLGDIVLSGSLAPSGEATASIAVTLPAALSLETYSLVAIVDPDNTVVENNEANNASAAGSSLTVTSGVVGVTIRWVNPAGGDWNDPLNWEGGRLPTASDVVSINADPGATITISGGTVWVQAIESFNPIAMNGGLLRVDGLLVTDQNIAFNGGSIQGGTVRCVGGATLEAGPFSSATLDGVTLDADLTLGERAALTVRNGLTLLNGHQVRIGNLAGLTFEGAAQTLAGAGEVVFASSSGGLVSALDAGQTLTIGAGIRVHGAGAGTGGGIRALTPIVNQGTIAADASGQVIHMQGDAFTNAGTVAASNGGQISLDGNYTTAQLGTLSNDGTGVIVLRGTLDNSGAVLTLTPTGSFAFAGTIQGGTVRSAGSAALVVSAFASATLDGVTLDADLTLSERAGLTVRNGLTLLNGHRVRITDLTAALTFAGASQTLGGAGEVIFASLDGGLVSALDAGQALTIGPGIRVHGAGVGTGGTIRALTPIVNQGTIASDASGQIIRIQGTELSNQGVLAAAGGNLFIDPSLHVDGSGVVTGAQGSVLFVSRDLLGSTRNGDLFGSQLEARFQGNGTFVAPQLLEAMSRDLGTDPAAFTHNFAYATLALSNGTYVQIVDQADNASGSSPEAVYTNALIVPEGTTLDLNGRNLYTRTAILGGTVVGGSIIQIADSGPIALQTTTAGAISSPGERDEWSFFARAGQLVTVSVDTGSSAVLAPALGLARVDLVTSTGAVLASATSSAIGELVNLQGITIPVDGTYRVVVTAPPAQPSVSGNYLISVWDVTPDVSSLLLNQQVVGFIENPFSIDQWQFSAPAGTQIRFDLINRQSEDIVFDLTGPPGFSGFVNLGTDSGFINLPSSGTYTLTAHGSGARGTGAYAFQIVQSEVTSLTLGAPYNGQFVGSGQSQLFVVDLPAAAPLELVLDDAASDNVNEVYLRFGAPPTRGEFDYRFDTSAAADQRGLAPMAYAGQWYVLVYSNTTRTDSTFTLTANSAGVVLDGVTPNRYATGETATINVQGGGFDSSTQLFLIAADSTVVAATSRSVASPSNMTATFSLAGVAPGVYSVRAVEAGGASDELTNAFTVTEPGAAHLETRLVLPEQLGRRAVATIYVEYTNTGNVAMPAPLLVLTAADRPLMSLYPFRLPAGLWSSSTTPMTFSTVGQFLASGATPGVLQPGESGRVAVHYAGLQRPWDLSDTSVEFSLGVLEANNTVAVDWNALRDSLRPDFVGADAWEAIWSNFTSQVGPTWGSYLTALNQNAAYLGTLGVSTVDIARLFGFELRQADAMSPIRYLAAGTDAAMSAPGLDLVFSRAFAQPISARYELGPLGRGWASNWEISLAAEADGTVAVTDMTGAPRVFQLDTRSGGGYFSSTGDNGRLVSLGGGTYRLTEADGTSYAFRADGRLDFVQDTNGNRITCGYNGAGLLTSLTHSSGQSLTIAYNAAGRVSSVTDSDGRQTLYAYDAANEHLISVRDFDGRVTSYEYVTGQGITREHAISQITFADGSHRLYTYDAQGRLASTSLDGGAERLTFTYDATGTVTVTDALGNTSTLAFDDGGAILRSTNALGNSVLLSLDQQRNLRSVTDPAGLTTLFQYDTRGNVTRSTDAMGHTTTFTYTADFNRLDSLTDANGNFTDYRYDNRGNLTGITYADGSQEGWSYDGLGQSTTWTNRRGTPVGFTYDTDGQVTSRTYADGTQITYTYDARGNLVSATDTTGTTTLTYDANDRLTRIDYPGLGGRFLAYTYDSAGRRATSTDQLGHQLRYEYDTVGRLSRITDETGAQVVLYEYDAAGRLVRKTLGNGVFTTYEYDAAGQLLHLVNQRSDGTVLSRFDYSYDSRGRRISMSTLDGAWAYSYDDIGQLTHAVFTSTNPAIASQDLRYVYDAMGNRVRTVENGVTTEYTTNNLNQYTHVGDTSYEYDADGNLISETSPTGTTLYSYDDESRLIAVQRGADAWAYTYDAFGQRVESTVNGITTRFTIDPIGLGNLVGEYDAAGNLIAGYDYGAGLLSRSANGASAWYTFDALGNAANLVDAAGTISSSHVYSPFGEILQDTGNGPNPFQFVGEWGLMNDGNGLEFMRARDYSPIIGRFVQADPIGIVGGINLYTYASNDPIGNIDPLGTVGIDPWMLGPVYERASDQFWNAVNAGARSVLTRASELLIWVHSRAPWIDDAVKFSGALVAREAGPPGAIPSGLVRYATPGLARVLPFASLAMGIWEGSNYAGRAYGNFLYENYPPERLPRVFQEFLGFAFAESVGASDPNQLLGPAGFGPQRFIDSSITLPYRVDFENEPTATAPAQLVTVTNQLDADLNWNTFALTEVGFGDLIIAVPAGSQYFETTVPMHYNGRDFEVQVAVGINLATGLVSARFSSIDPNTGLPPDVLTGFLPPEDGTGRGMGHFSYSVAPRTASPTGTEIRNIALIVFDGQPAIATNQIDPHNPAAGTDPNREALNTLDAVGPSSAVQPLPATSSSASFLVSWAGTDDAGGSGIANYDVYVSTDGGAFSLWQQRTTATSAAYSGSAGHTYAFYSIARDNVGHVEAAPSTADAITRVVAANQAPVANDDVASTAEDTPVVVAVLANDSDADVNALTVVLVGGPAHGSVVLNADQSFTYTPAANYFGPDSFTYRVNDGQADSGVATVAVMVAPVNDPPVAVADLATTARDTPVVLQLAGNDTDVDLDALAVISVTVPSHGTAVLNADGTVIYTPAAQYVGADSFTYTVSDGQGGTAVGSVSITVIAVNRSPVATDDTASTPEDTPVVVAVLANDSDADGDALTVVLVSGPAHGSVVLNADRSFTYTPAANYFGADSFTYRVNDGQADSAVATVSLTVTPVNDAPTIGPVAPRTINEGSPLTLVVGGTDPDGDPLTYTLDGAPAGASIDPTTGVFTWTPADGPGQAQITVRATDPGGASGTAAFSVTVQNVAPTLVLSGAAAATQGQPYTLNLSATDPGQDTVSGWVIHWGDGSVQNVAGNPSSVTHVYATPGSATISATASDEDGTYSANTRVVNVGPAAAAPPRVSSFSATPSGFRVTFDHAIDPSVLNLYDTRTGGLGAADVTLVGARSGAVSGSMVIDADGMGLTFIQTGGLLAPDTYTVRLVSGANAFRDAQGRALDGNGDGTGGDAFRATFTVALPGRSLSIPDFMRGPGQAVDLTDPSRNGYLPVYLSNGFGVRQVEFTLRYDPALLSIGAVLAGPDLPRGATIERLAGPEGTLTVRITSPTAIGFGRQQLLNIQASVPTTAASGAAQALDLDAVRINGVAGTGDDALQVVGYFADADGDGTYTLQDAALVERVALGLDDGFGQYVNFDPVAVADVNGNGRVDTVDALRVLQEARFIAGAGGSDRPELPPIPPGLGLAGTGSAANTPVNAAVQAAPLGVGPLLAGTAPQQEPSALLNTTPSTQATPDTVASTPVPVIDFAGASLRAESTAALVPAAASQPWLKDYLLNAGQPAKVSPNLAWKVTLPVAKPTGLLV
ncbi:MAG: tandem-95 repeat protein [Rubrivivax sp.]|nr:tandem-95 repeat protein [Rubrivivax sp.]